MEEFIVDCTNNSPEERAEVYKWLVETRNYNLSYLKNVYKVIVCNESEGLSNWDSVDNAKKAFSNHPVYTFE